MNEFLANLKEGSEVIADYGYHSRALVRIDRVTPTQFVVGDRRFSRKTGHLCGERGFYRGSLAEATPEKADVIVRKTLLAKLRNMLPEHLDGIPTDKIRFAVSLLEASPHAECGVPFCLHPGIHQVQYGASSIYNACTVHRAAVQAQAEAEG